MSFTTRNLQFCATHPRKAWATRKAMKAHKKAHPVCEWDRKSRKGCEVHHIEPVSRYPWLAADPTNLITLSKRAHFVVGHACNYRSYVSNVRELCLRAAIHR